MLNLEENQFSFSFQDDISSEFLYFNDIKHIDDEEQEQEPKNYEDFFLYCELNNDYKVESLIMPEESSTKDKASGSNMGDSKSDTDESIKSYMMVPFDGKTPNMDEFLRLIQNDMCIKGANQMVCDALDIKSDEDLWDETPQLIKIKKRKSKEQLRALEEEFAQGSDWSKEFMNGLAEKLKLDPAQVYKWHWDQIWKKLGKNPKKKEKEIKKKLNPEMQKKRKRTSAPKSATKLQKREE